VDIAKSAHQEGLGYEADARQCDSQARVGWALLRKDGCKLDGLVVKEELTIVGELLPIHRYFERHGSWGVAW
jgi:hypothetical protein